MTVPKKWLYVFDKPNVKKNNFVIRSVPNKFKVQIYFQKTYQSQTKIKRRTLGILVSILVILLPATCQAQRGEKISTVVIDAGHGGKDPGAVGRKCNEKDVNLSVALKLGKYITDNMKDVKVVYTRSTDVFVPLVTRATIANTNKADVFISIHCNAAKDPKANGIETFIMGEHKNAANMAVAQRENASILMEDNADDAYEGFDPNAPESYIMFSLIQGEFKERSRQMANLVQDKLISSIGHTDRGAQQAGFLVLYRTAMPSILVELGFVSNPDEEKYLSSPAGQDCIAKAIGDAFCSYKTAYEAENSDIPQDIVIPQAPQPEEVKQPEIKQETKLDTVVERPLITPPAPPAQDAAGEVVFKVQFDSRAVFVPLTDTLFRNVENVSWYEHDKTYKYTSGCFSTRSQAVEHQTRMRQAGYSDAFVVAFHNGKRISTAEAEKILSNENR